MIGTIFTSSLLLLALHILPGLPALMPVIADRAVGGFRISTHPRICKKVHQIFSTILIYASPRLETMSSKFHMKLDPRKSQNHRNFHSHQLVVNPKGLHDIFYRGRAHKNLSDGESVSDSESLDSEAALEFVQGNKGPPIQDFRDQDSEDDDDEEDNDSEGDEESEEDNEDSDEEVSDEVRCSDLPMYIVI